MHRAAALLAGCALLVVACGGATGDPDTARAGEAPVLPASAAQRWVGLNAVMLAVPAGWRTSTSPCEAPDGPVVHFPGARGAVVDCSHLPTSGVRSVTVAPASSGQLTVPAGGRTTRELRGLRIQHSEVVCVPHRPFPEQCTTTVLVPEANASFRISAPGRGAGQLVRRVLASLRPVPDGYTAVPAVGFGTSVGRAEDVLRRSGLGATSPDVDFPHYATGTDPSAGSVVEDGSTVALTIGDG